MELRDYLAILWLRWRTVASCVVVVMLLALTYSVMATPMYIARASVFFSVSVDQTSGQLSRGFAYTQNLASLYSRVATQPVVMDRVIKDLGLSITSSELADKVVARAPQDTVIIQILVTDAHPQLAAQIANAVAKELRYAVASLSPKSGSGTNASAVLVHLTTVSPATVPSAPSSPQTGRNVALALVVGVMIGGAAALLRHSRAAGVNRREVAWVTETQVIATLDSGETGGRLRSFLRSGTSPSHPRDQFVRLRTNFEHLREQRKLRSVVFTSAADDMMTNWVVTGLADSLAQAGVRVLLVDGDLRRPSLAEHYAVGAVYDAEGLCGLLSGGSSWASAVHRVGSRLPDLLPAGQPLDDPSLMLSGDAVTAGLAELADGYDVVLVKAPPVRWAAEGLLLAKCVDGVVLVAHERLTDRRGLADAVESLELVRAELVAVVLTS
jgi:capsular polysaccharide biosynthesis protein/Mrp family chromosome partitioning ATPase